MIRSLKEYFSFTRRETRALLFVLVLLFFSIIYRLWMGNRVPQELFLTNKEREEIMAFIDSFEKKTENRIDNYPVKNEYQLPVLFPFDPQVADMNDFLDLGISEFVANNLIKYREAGGKFTQAEDMRKIYGMDEELFQRLKPYVRITEDSLNIAFVDPVLLFDEKLPAKELPKVFELNTAGFRDLISMEGMEGRLAGRIIKYRELIGGFYSMDQLEEVYGMTDSIKHLLSEYIIIDTTSIKKIHLKSITYSELLRHPYLEKSDVQKIFSLKNFYGDSICFSHIQQNHILPDSTLDRIRPYLSD
jgi:DNA uptake protein ComE-like DNA-binding protein